jgi:hypothetical protein
MEPARAGLTTEKESSPVTRFKSTPNEPERANRAVCFTRTPRPGITIETFTPRPKLQQLLRDAQAGKFDIIVLTRQTEPDPNSISDLADWIYLVAVCDATGVRLETPEGLCYDPTEREL